MIRKTLTLLTHLGLIVDYFVRAWTITLFTKDPFLRRKRLSKNIHNLAKRFLKAFRMNVKISGLDTLKAFDGTPLLIVGNHVSYTDIVVLSALDELIFITSVEMGNNPFLGTLTRAGGCLYTNRKNPLSLMKEIERFSAVLASGFKVVLFPEGTSTNGDTVQDFRRSLFEIAARADSAVLPVCIKYKSLDGKEIDSSNRDDLYWYGDMTFAPHFMALLGKSIEVEVNFLEPIFDTARLKRSAISDAAHAQILQCFHKKQNTI